MVLYVCILFRIENYINVYKKLRAYICILLYHQQTTPPFLSLKSSAIYLFTVVEILR